MMEVIIYGLCIVIVVLCFALYSAHVRSSLAEQRIKFLESALSESNQWVYVTHTTLSDENTQNAPVGE